MPNLYLLPHVYGNRCGLDKQRFARPDLLLRWDEDGASLVTGNASSVFRGLAITHATADPLPPAHLIVKIETDRGDSITVTAPFALFPLPQP